MGVQDTVTKRYMKDPRRFADAFNFLVFNGERKVIPERLKELDTELLDTLPGGWNGKDIFPVQRRRDLLKVIYYSDGDAIYCLAGIENQTEIDYSMPLRCFLYDALTLSAKTFRTPAGADGKKGASGG